jgi:hypothetical protein
MTTTAELWAGEWSGEVHAADEFVSVVIYAFNEGWGKRLIGGDMIVAQDDPQTGAIALLLSADGAMSCMISMGWGVSGVSSIGRSFDSSAMVLWCAHKISEYATRIVYQIAKTLRNKNGVHFTRSWLVEVLQVVIGKWFFESNFDGDERLVGIWEHFKWHNNVLHYAGHLG